LLCSRTDVGHSQDQGEHGHDEDERGVHASDPRRGV
jgi:hypothetical protein